LRWQMRVWLQLDHINILPFFGTTMGFGRLPAMVCPWLENGSLTSYLEGNDDNLTTPKRLILLSDIAAGLQYLHSRSVVHGDLSGSNTLIQDNGRACIADFGQAVLLTELDESSTAGAPGALRWVAPELVVGLTVEEEDTVAIFATPQSDVYSFGGIMLQILTGKVPYDYYPDEEQVLLAISQGETPQRPSRSLITDRRWTFIQRCWSSLDESQSRPSDEEMVEFTTKELADENSESASLRDFLDVSLPSIA
ncbi:kinase-like domain-containing protein, partial [Melanogaster broomeanus]